MLRKKFGVLTFALVSFSTVFGMEEKTTSATANELDRGVAKTFIVQINKYFDQLLSDPELLRAAIPASLATMLASRSSSDFVAQLSYSGVKRPGGLTSPVSPAGFDSAKFLACTAAINENLKKLSTCMMDQLPRHAMLTQHRLVVLIKTLIEHITTKIEEAEKNMRVPSPALPASVSALKSAYKLKNELFARLAHINTALPLFDQSIESGVCAVSAVAEKEDRFHICKLLGALLDAGTRVKTEVDVQSMDGRDDKALLMLLDKYTVSVTPFAATVEASSASSSASSSVAASASSSGGTADAEKPMDVATAVKLGVTFGGMARENWPAMRDTAIALRDSDFKAYESMLLSPITNPTVTGAANYFLTMFRPATNVFCSASMTNKTLAVSAYVNGIKAVRGLLEEYKVYSAEEFDKKMHLWAHNIVETGTEVLKSKKLEAICSAGDRACKGIEVGTPYAEKFAEDARKAKSETDAFLSFLQSLGAVDVSCVKRGDSENR